jgi:predicted permease
VVPSRVGLFIQNFGEKKDVYLLMGQDDDAQFRQRSSAWGTDGIGRLKPGVSVDQARADTAVIARALSSDYPDIDKGIGIKIVPLKDAVVGNVRPSLLVLQGAVVLLLLIACVNIANLLLSRTSCRTGEFAVRIALGASQWRIARQLLTESVLLATAGGVLGLVLAKWGTRASLRWMPTDLPRANHIGLDGKVLAFTFTVSVLAGILFGLGPALRTARLSLQDSMKDGGRGFIRGRNRTQALFVTAEMALALVLLIGAGLMLRTLTRLWNVDPGFDPRQVQVFSISAPLPDAHPTPQVIASTVRRIHDTVKAAPGIEAMSLSWGAFPMLDDNEIQFWIEGQPKPASKNDMNWALEYIVEPDYFTAMRIRLKRGRLLTDQDDEHAPAVVVVDERLVQQFFPSQDPLGKHIQLNDYQHTAEIVGVVEHVKQFGLAGDDTNTLQAQMYEPLLQLADQPQSGASLTANIFVRSREDEHVVEDGIRRTLQRSNSRQVIGFPTSMEKAVRRSIAGQRFFMLLLGIFAALALVLASVGTYGVVSYFVAQRTREIGVRIALGAQRANLLRMVLRQGIEMALAGVVIGVVAALVLTRLMASMLYGVTTYDPLTFVAVGLLLSAIALLACYVPARRAAGLDPMVALRHD